MVYDMDFWKSCLLIVCLVSVNSASQRIKIVERTENGQVEGFQISSFGNKVFVYKGIPYAKPPVGDRRFKKPETPDPWDGVLNATSYGNSCMQISGADIEDFVGYQKWSPNTEIHEDCLTVNVWTPEFLPKKATVMIWIYGGGFVSGTSSLDVYDGATLAATGSVVVVSFNYRLGAFGFMYLGNDEAPGNMGLWDQKLAIEWVRHNIQYFGGDPESITLFGESAGAASVSAHLLNPVTRKLVKKGILQSGAINAPWATLSAEKAKEHAWRYIESCGCANKTTNDIEEIENVMRCMRRLNSSYLILKQESQYNGSDFRFIPTIDGVYLPDSPVKMMEDGYIGDHDVLVGTNHDEGSYFLLNEGGGVLNRQKKSSIERGVQHQLIDDIFSEETEAERSVIKLQYTDWETVNESLSNDRLLSDALGDKMFTCPCNQLADMYTLNGNTVYYYYFIHRTASSPWGKWMGVLHGDEIDYVFGHPKKSSSTYTPSENLLSYRMMEYFTTFAKTGKPLPEKVYRTWPMYTAENPKYFVLTTRSAGRGNGPRAKECAVWNWLFPKLRELHLPNPPRNNYPRFTVLPERDGIKEAMDNATIVLIY